jgi:hypothetical protein
MMGKILKFEGVKGKDVYNPTGPLRSNDEKYIIARVEERETNYQDSGYRPYSQFFVEKKDCWFPVKNFPVFSLEDPFKTYIDKELVFGGVEIYGNPGKRKFRTVFFRGESIKDLKKFAVGPEMMKDIRIVDLFDGRIGVFTRPQGEKHQKGRIGFTVINKLEDLNEKNISQAEVIKDDLKSNEWEGVNGAKLLKSGKIAVLGHRASINQEEKKKYSAMTFELDPYAKTVENFKVVAVRSDFPETLAKTPFLKDVVFPGELDYDYHLYAGLSDTSGGVKKIDNPYNEDFM